MGKRSSGFRIEKCLSARIKCLTIVFVGLVQCFAVRADDVLHDLSADPNLVITEIGPDDLVEGDWTPVSAEYLQRFLRKQQEVAANGAALAVVESAVYSATFTEDGLQSGTCEFEIAHRGLGSAVLDWSEMDVALHGLMHAGRPAIWGTGSDGRKLMVVGTSGTWTGEWNVRGWHRLDRTVVELTLPKALNSRLELRVPQGRVVSSSTGLISGPKRDPAEPSWDIWTIELGRRNDARLSLGDSSATSRETPVLGQIETLYNARVDGLYFQVDASITQGRRSPAAVTFRVPPAAQILSVSYSGSPIAFERSEDSPGRLTVLLGEASTSAGRIALRLQGFQSVDWQRPRTTLPRIDFDNVTEIERRDKLVVESPLVVSSLSTSGLVQTGLQQDEVGEVWSFLGTAPRSRIVVTIQRPDPKMLIRSRVVADAAAPVPVAAAELYLEGQEGSAFTVGLDWPPDWDVVAIDGSDASSRLARWELTEAPGGRTLHIEFRQPLLPGAKRVLRLRARAAEEWSNEGFQLPVPLLQEPGTCDATCWLLTEPTTAYSLLGETRYAGEQVAAPPAELFDMLPSESPRAGLVTERWSWSGSSGSQRPKFRLSTAQSAAIPDLPPTDMITPAPGQEITAGSATSTGRIVCTLKLSTTASDTLAGRHVHRAAYWFSRPVAIQELGLQLSERATLSMLSADGVPVTVLRSGKDIQLPAEVAPCRWLEIVYAAPAPGSGIYRASTVPLPELKPTVLHIDWLLELPRQLRLSGTNLAVAASDQPENVKLGDRLLGPLYRAAGRGWFAPWSPSDWHALVSNRRPHADAQDSFHPVQIVSTTVPGEILFTTWDRERTELFAWVCLLGALTVVTLGRMLCPAVIRRGCIAWLALLAGTSFLVNDAGAILCGGAFSGTLLGVLIPRRLVRRRDLLAGLSLKKVLRPSIGSKRAVAAGGLITLATSLWMSSLPARLSAQPAVERIEVAVLKDSEGAESFFVRQALARKMAEAEQEHVAARPLIRSARYRLKSEEQNASIEVDATFEVLVQNTPSEQLFAIPLQNIVFRQEHRCTIDGHDVPIIPSLDGRTVLLRLPDEQRGPSEQPAASGDSSPMAGDDSPSMGWAAHQVQMSFLIRGQTSADGGLIFQAQIPGVADAIVETKGFVPDLHRYGTRSVLADGELRSHVGSVSQLKSVLVADRRPPPSATVLSLLDVSPLGIEGTLQILLLGRSDSGPDSADHVLSIQLPDQTIVRSVSGDSVVEWRTQSGPDGQQNLGVVLRDGENSNIPSRIAVEFEMPLRLDETNEFSLPMVHIGSAEVTHHDLGISVPPGWQAEAAGKLPFSTDEFDAETWQQYLAQSRSRLAWTGRIVTPAQARWRLVPPVQDWSWRIDETVRIQADSLHWSARLDSGMLPSRVFYDTLRLSPEITLESVSAVQSGRQRPVRWGRREDELSLFFTDEISGPLSVFLEGSVPLAGETRTALPRLTPLRPRGATTRLTVLDQTGWSVQLFGRQTDPTEFPSDPERVGELRTLQTFTDPEQRPTEVRVVPGPDAAAARLVSAAARVGGRWEVTTILNVVAKKGPLRTVTIELPANQRLVRVLPDRIEKSTTVQEDGTSRLTLRIPPRFAATFKATLVARITDEPGRLSRLAGPKVTSATELARWVILPSTLGRRLPPDAATPASITQLQDMIPAVWIQRLSENQTSAYAVPGPEVPLTAAPRRESKARIPLAEVAVWNTGPNHQRGELTWWLVTSELQRLEFETPESATIGGVYVDGVASSFEQVKPGRFAVNIDRPRTIVPVTVTWDRPSGVDVRWPHPVTPSAESHLLSAMAAEPLLPGNSEFTPLAPLDAALDRWERLQQCLEIPGLTLSVDAALLVDLRRWRERVPEMVRDVPTRERAAYERRIANLQSRWETLQEEIVVTADSVGTSASPFPGDLLRRLIELGKLTESRYVYRVPGQVSQTRITKISWWGGIVTRVLSVAAVLGLALLLNFAVRCWPVGEWLERHGGLSLASLGVLWWLWLISSPFGFLLTVFGLTIETVVVLRGLGAGRQARERSVNSTGA